MYYFGIDEGTVFKKYINHALQISRANLRNRYTVKLILYYYCILATFFAYSYYIITLLFQWINFALGPGRPKKPPASGMCQLLEHMSYSLVETP